MLGVRMLEDAEVQVVSNVDVRRHETPNLRS
jgi:hypothetical protein